MATYTHSVSIDPEKCTGCTTCLRRCPVEAIRIRDDRAKINPLLCIDCGECIRVCNHSAKHAVYDRIEELDTIPDILVSASAVNGYIQAGTSQITVRTAAAITKNDISIIKNGEVQGFDMTTGESGVYDITLSDAARMGDRYTLKLENAAFGSVKRYRFISDGLAAVTACGTRKEGDTLYLSIKTLNKTGSPQKMNIVTAFYKNGKMQDAAMNTVLALNGEMTSEFSLKTGVPADNYKIFLAAPESLERLD